MSDKFEINTRLGTYIEFQHGNTATILHYQNHRIQAYVYCTIVNFCPNSKQQMEWTMGFWYFGPADRVALLLEKWFISSQPTLIDNLSLITDC